MVIVGLIGSVDLVGFYPRLWCHSSDSVSFDHIGGGGGLISSDDREIKL